MITVEEATQLILSQTKDFGVESISWDKSLGRVLAEDIHADRNFPPFNRVMMDGIAIRKEDFDTGLRKFPVKGLLAAGDPPFELHGSGTCMEIMTGSALPKSVNCVIPYEQVTIADGLAHVDRDNVTNMMNVHLEGMDRNKGDLLIASGTEIGQAEIAILTTVGAVQVLVNQLPRITIVSTGDELVDVDQSPLPHQIRKSNVYALQALCREFSIEPNVIHIPDSKNEIRKELQGILDVTDVLLLSGGVSKGKKDFLPEILEELGITKSFHRVKQRPGKPFWFGYSEKLTCFAFPGNPASTFMCSIRYFQPWLQLSLGLGSIEILATLEEDFNFKPDLTYFLQSAVSLDQNGRLKAIPRTGQGSGDLANLVDTNAFLEMPRERDNFEKGQIFRCWPFRKII
ncbi:MAG: molybdopterin molybdotransferase MoeA [Flavobacteriales bacterium]|nr:molybdopterin molybdotransferase MoeA [Flavobacteriales bacterium]